MLERFAGFIAQSANVYNVPETWIRAVILTESSGNPNAFRSTSPRDTSYGLMQLTLPTALGLGFSGDPNNLFDPETNIDLGTKLLGQLRQRFGDDVSAVYSAYNSGGGSNYLSNSSVAAHVNNFLNNLSSVAAQVETAIADNPGAATGGGIGIVLVLILVWYFVKQKG